MEGEECADIQWSFNRREGSGFCDFGRGGGMVFSRVQAPAVFAYPAVVPVAVLSFVA